MKLKPLYTLLVLLVSTVVPLPGLAGDIKVENAWSLPLPPVSKNGAAYLTVMNHGELADRLVAATSSVSERVELHKHVNQDGQMTMEQMDFVEIPMQGSAVFSPGTMHVMLFGLTAALVEGGHFTLTLEFEKAGQVEVIVNVTMDGAGSMDSAIHTGNTGSTE
jgi:hypothetical protein